MKTGATPADCPLLTRDGKVKAMDLSFWRVIFPILASLVITIIGAAWALSSRLSSLDGTVRRLESVVVPREVIDLQLQTIRLEMRNLDVKIDAVAAQVREMK